ncbi:MAG TPA: TOMM precursor leader peptide-binding protein [Thermoanaerobaculia bacterium]
MKADPTDGRRALRVLAVHVQETADGVLLTRGAQRLTLKGPGAFEAVQYLFEQLAPGELDREAFLARLDEAARGTFSALLDSLLKRRMLEEVAPETPLHVREESPEDIFYWELGRDGAEVHRAFDRLRLAVVGVNAVSLHLLAALRDSGFQQLRIVDAPDLRNLRFFDAAGRLRPDRWPATALQPLAEADFEAQWGDGGRPVCLVATSDFGGRDAMRNWNERCLDEGVHFLPVGLREGVGSIGPLVVPGETPCYECARGRENSNTPDPGAWRAQERTDFDTQLVAGNHPAAPRILADLAAFELCRFYAGLGFGPIGRVLTVSLLDMELRAHKLLRLPRCPACGRFQERARAALGRAYRPAFSEGPPASTNAPESDGG